ncbi:hypothetical protein MCOR02_005101 [Pyricularia oryzae]|nr:hypothetical protein MCOR02_005101 [Pyricularia oryzae]KAI6321412.1 hypothetical protein MCOR34_002613 [Pyricularia oryzae]KAI6474579.1 hypothetical protein MCOR17_002016 [Pyricularia oryzae]KAI6505600.1 hypothetical protein MCOR13_004099 [Pyricularia oryzae]KAI6559998.1 hypothetical protein MCOR04_009758 [Pyricularia oryzae]
MQFTHSKPTPKAANMEPCTTTTTTTTHTNNTTDITKQDLNRAMAIRKRAASDPMPSPLRPQASASATTQPTTRRRQSLDHDQENTQKGTTNYSKPLWAHRRQEVSQCRMQTRAVKTLRTGSPARQDRVVKKQPSRAGRIPESLRVGRENPMFNLKVSRLQLRIPHSIVLADDSASSVRLLWARSPLEGFSGMPGRIGFA